MPSLDERSGSICLWLVSILLLVATASGGLLLVLVLLLPEDNVTRWFPDVGLILVGTPWVFWFLMALYRCFLGGASGDDVGGGLPEGGALAAKDAGGEEGTAASPEGKRVRFGLATVMSSKQGPAPEGEGETVTPGLGMALEVVEGDTPVAGPPATDSSHESFRKESSTTASSVSRERELPLTLAPSS